MKGNRGFSPYDQIGNRTYLTIEERNAFLCQASKEKPEVMTFCMVLAYTGARISEVLALTARQIDFSLQCIVIKCLKKRGNIIYRTVPVPRPLLLALDHTHNLKDRIGTGDRLLWPWCRTTAWSHVGKVMRQAELTGIHANARGLRHTFAVSAIQSGIALNMVQKWMGHADIETTALYANAIGPEELSIAYTLWQQFKQPPIMSDLDQVSEKANGGQSS